MEPIPAGMRAHMTRVGGVVLVVGGVLGVVVSLIIEGSDARTLMMLVLSALTVLLGVGYLTLEDRVSSLLLLAGPPVGTALVTGMIYLGGGGVTSAALAMPYVWIAAYAGYFHSTGYLIGILALGAVGHALALSGLDEGPWRAPIWIYAAATSAVAGGMVHILARQLRDLAATDPLTRLPNRRAWDERLAHHLALAGRLGHPLCVVMMDVDGFKEFNDSRGHAAGDAALRAIAEGGALVLRGTDVLARIGGDEFALLLPACDVTAAREIVSRIRDATDHGLSLSAGVASWDGEESAERVMRRADAALYWAKDLGRDRVELADAPETVTRVPTRT